MEQMKAAIQSLEQSIARLEIAVETSKQNNSKMSAEIASLKSVVKQTHDRIEKALTSFRQKEEA